jgi:hypothetical protein
MQIGGKGIENMLVNMVYLGEKKKNNFKRPCI